MSNNCNTGSNSTTSSTSATALDSSFRLELVNLPVWWRHAEQAKEGTNDGLALQKLPWAAAVIEELRRTDNILVTEIGERGLLEFLQDGLMPTSCDDIVDRDGDEADEQQIPCDWELQDEASFRYLMEILQANMIYFLKRRYFDLERCRDTPSDSKSSNSIAKDFSIIFDKASSSRYLTNRGKVAHVCFLKPYQQKGNHNGICPKTIKNALVRLHRRAGIYLPQPVKGRSYHPSPVEHNSLEDGVDAYWIDLWWVCSSLLTWILEPCLEITRSIENADHYLCPTKRRKMIHNHSSDPAGFLRQRLIKIPFSLIRSHTQTIGLYYDKVLLHDGPWDENEDEDYVIYNSNNSSSNINNDQDSDDDDDCSDESSQDKDTRAVIAAKELMEANGGNGTMPIAEAKLQNQGWENGSNETFKTPYFVNQPQTGEGKRGNRKNHPTQMTGLTCRSNEYEAQDKNSNEEINAVAYDSFWANKNENLDVLGSGVFRV